MKNLEQCVGVFGYNSSDAHNDAQGVHWFWWLLIALIPGPLLLLVGYIHHQRMKRAMIFYSNSYNGIKPYDGL